MKVVALLENAQLHSRPGKTAFPVAGIHVVFRKPGYPSAGTVEENRLCCGGFGVIAALLLISCALLSACDYGRMWETPAIRPHERPMPEMPKGVIPVDGGEAVYEATPTYLLRSSFRNGDPEVLNRGRALYRTYCAQCHGLDHDGNGTVGQSFQPLPGDLRSSRIQTMQGGRLFKEISYGIPGGRQPPLATTIDVPDRWRIIAYVKSLGTRR